MMLETEIFHIDPDITGVSCAGRFTLGTRLSEAETLINNLIWEGARKMVIDLTHVEFVDSAGLGVIMHIFGTLEQEGGKLRVAGPSGQVQRLFHITHTEPDPVSRPRPHHQRPQAARRGRNRDCGGLRTFPALPVWLVTLTDNLPIACYAWQPP